MASPADNVQKLIDDTRTAVQAEQIVRAAASGGESAARQVAGSMSTEDLQRVQQHLNR